LPSIVFMFEVHQPYRLNRNFIDSLLKLPPNPSFEDLFKAYFDEKLNRDVIRRVAGKCYLPASRIILENIDRYRNSGRSFKVSFSISGVFIEQALKYAPEIIDLFRELVDTGCVELVEQTYYHSLASLFPNKLEFMEQLEEHRGIIKDTFGVEPRVAENTEFIYNNSVAFILDLMGYKAVFTEGVERILGWRSPNYVYKAKGLSIKLLFRNYRLSDDIGFRFSSKDWEEYPLTAEKYSAWLSAVEGDVVCICMDYETFGEHHWPESGIHEFLRWLPGEILKWRNLEFLTPSEAIEKYPAKDEIEVPDDKTISWADLERDTSAWLQNPLQKSSFEAVKRIEPYVKAVCDDKYIKLWRYLQISDHYYYMSTKGGGPGEVHGYFSPYGSPIEAYTTFHHILSDLTIRILNEYKRLTDRKEIFKVVEDAKAFHFYLRDDKPLPIKARCIPEFIKALLLLPNPSIEHHLKNNDFRKWLKQVFRADRLAEDIYLLCANADILKRNITKIMSDLCNLRQTEKQNER